MYSYIKLWNEIFKNMLETIKHSNENIYKISSVETENKNNINILRDRIDNLEKRMSDAGL